MAKQTNSGGIATAEPLSEPVTTNSPAGPIATAVAIPSVESEEKRKADRAANMAAEYAEVKAAALTFLPAFDKDADGSVWANTERAFANFYAKEVKAGRKASGKNKDVHYSFELTKDTLADIKAGIEDYMAKMTAAIIKRCEASETCVTKSHTLGGGVLPWFIVAEYFNIRGDAKQRASDMVSAIKNAR